MSRRLICFVLLLVCLLAGCSSGKQAATTTTTEPNVPIPEFPAGTSMARIQQTGSIKVGVRYDQPGFALENPQTKQIEGFEAELARTIAQHIFGGSRQEAATKVQFIQTVAINRQTFIENGDVDIVLSGYVMNDTRRQAVDFAGPYYIGHGELMARANDTTIRSVADVNGKRVCIVRNSTYDQSLRQQAPQVTFVTVDTYKQCTDELAASRVDAVAADSVLLAGLVQASAKAFRLVGTEFTNEPYGIGLKKGDTAFRTFLTDQLTEMNNNGAWRSAFERTLGKFDLRTPQPPVPEKVVATTTTTSAAPITTSTTAVSTSTTARP